MSFLALIVILLATMLAGFGVGVLATLVMVVRLHIDVAKEIYDFGHGIVMWFVSAGGLLMSIARLVVFFAIYVQHYFFDLRENKTLDLQWADNVSLEFLEKWLWPAIKKELHLYPSPIVMLVMYTAKQMKLDMSGVGFRDIDADVVSTEPSPAAEGPPEPTAPPSA